MFARLSSSSTTSTPSAPPKSPSHTSSFSLTTSPPSFFSSSSSSQTTTAATTIATNNGGPPTDPLPLTGSRPSDLLVSRCHEVKRISKMLVGYFEGLSVAHLSHSTTLIKLSDPKLIQTPLAESTLFLPAKSATTSTLLSSSTSGATTPNISNGGGGGWAELSQQIKETNTLVAEEHASLAKNLNKNVVVPLKKIRTDMKTHVAALEKEVNKLIEAVLKERESSATILSSLSTAITSAGLPLATIGSDPSQDPVLLKAAAASQIKQQVIKENELLTSVLAWTERTEAKEKEAWREINRCWSIWETANSSMLLTNQQRSMMLSAGVDGVAPETEWNYFQRSNFILPPETPLRSPDEVEYAGRDDPLTQPIKEGLLDRQSRILKSWKPSFYILTPSGNLHTYVTSASPIPSPTSSLNLALCSLGPMPIPNEPTKGKALEALFTIMDGEGTKHLFRAKSWEELSAWWIELEKFTKSLSSPTLQSPTASNHTVPSTTAFGVLPVEDQDHHDAVLEAMEEEHPAEGEHDSENPSSDEDDDHDRHDAGDIGSPLPTTPRKKSIFSTTESEAPSTPTRTSFTTSISTGDLADALNAKEEEHGTDGVHDHGHEGRGDVMSGDGLGDIGIPKSPHQGPPILTESVESPQEGST